LELRRLVESDPVVRVQASWHKFGTFGEDLVWNLMVHDVAIGMGLFNKPPVGGRFLYSWGQVTETDSAAATLSFGSDEDELLIEINRCSPSEAKVVTVTMASGRVLLWSGATLFECNDLGLRPVFERPDVQPLDLELAAFERQIRSGERPLTGGEFGREVVSAMEGLAPL